MRRLLSIFLTSCLLIALPCSAETDNVKQAVDWIVLLCGASGEKVNITGNVNVDGGIALKRLGASGGAELKLSKSEVRGLIDALNSKLSTQGAEQATQARRCMEQRLDRILDATLPRKQTVAPVRPSNCRSNTTFQCAADLRFDSDEASSFSKSESRYYRFSVDEPSRLRLRLEPMPNTRDVKITVHDSEYNLVEEKSFRRGMPGSFSFSVRSGGSYFIKLDPSSCCGGDNYDFGLTLMR